MREWGTTMSQDEIWYNVPSEPFTWPENAVFTEKEIRQAFFQPSKIMALLTMGIPTTYAYTTMDYVIIIGYKNPYFLAKDRYNKDCLVNMEGEVLYDDRRGTNNNSDGSQLSRLDKGRVP